MPCTDYRGRGRIIVSIAVACVAFASYIGSCYDRAISWFRETVDVGFGLIVGDVPRRIDERRDMLAGFAYTARNKNLSMSRFAAA